MKLKHQVITQSQHTLAACKNILKINRITYYATFSAENYLWKVENELVGTILNKFNMNLASKPGGILFAQDKSNTEVEEKWSLVPGQIYKYLNSCFLNKEIGFLTLKKLSAKHCATLYDEETGKEPFLIIPEGEIKDLGLYDLSIDWSDKVSAIKVEPGCKLVGWRSQHFCGKVFKDF